MGSAAVLDRPLKRCGLEILLAEMHRGTTKRVVDAIDCGDSAMLDFRR